ncbi:TetR/AcrR family transcriptional regulator [Gemmobacter sp.]|uniref:TetR/AcrR family transcriptional regulator n=1 Tax=Gemmobacter sp. TaxID=1898957 RepID=UPI002AFFFCC9|nr:TetR/AcrR family transcriptional regulator [Gemmobacter sp.]
MDEGAAEYVARRQELIQIAAGIFKTKGYSATTFADIASHTGIDRATLYYYLGSKEEIFRDAVRGALTRNIEGMRRIMADSALDAVTKLQQLIEMLMVSYHNNYPYLFVYLQQDLNTIINDDREWAEDVEREVRLIEEAFASLVRQGIETGDLRDDIPVALSLNAIFGMLNWSHRWYSPEGRNTPEAVARAFNCVFLDGMRRR